MAWLQPVTLEGDHVRLEPAADRHLPDLVGAARDARIWAWLPWPQPRSQDDLAAILASERRIAFPFAQVDRTTGRAVGITTYRDIDERHRTIEVGGTWLSSAVWRTAINTEAKLLILGHAFERLHANRVAIKTDVGNERSQTAIERLGAKREGVVRHQYIRPDGTLRDTILYSIIPEEWPSIRAYLRERLAADQP